MGAIFQTLYNLNPLLPVMYVVIMANGLIAPTIYCAARRIPYDITRVWELVKKGDRGARYVFFSWVVFSIASVFVIAVSMYF
ncbi:MAG: hypothetical protein ACK41V_06345 [Acidovorax sp.]|uniref:hypothetical protein n=1 Tax=Acidovorax sp. TaxID=1872122 RepID=UPI003919BFCE